MPPAPANVIKIGYKKIIERHIVKSLYIMKRTVPFLSYIRYNLDGGICLRANPPNFF